MEMMMEMAAVEQRFLSPLIKWILDMCVTLFMQGLSVCGGCIVNYIPAPLQKLLGLT
jgi:hypothetical protein